MSYERRQSARRGGPISDVAVIVVSYRTPGDVAACLEALDQLPAAPSLGVFVCENGGPEAWEALRDELLSSTGPCLPSPAPAMAGDRFARVARCRLRVSGRTVQFGQAHENLGYAGGVNAWLVPLCRSPQWQAFWILNPDALVSVATLSALIASAETRSLGMVGSRLMIRGIDHRVRSSGLRWRKLRANTEAVGYNSEVATASPPELLDKQIDAPSGASLLMTRACAKALIPLDESYFLYFEDLEWGIHAKSLGHAVGYAHDSVVVHAGGRSLGSPSERSRLSPLAIYLAYRNRLIFVARYFPLWWPWTLGMSCVYAVKMAGSGGVMLAFRGILAGIRMETGRPDALIRRHRVPGGAEQRDAASSTVWPCPKRGGCVARESSHQHTGGHDWRGNG